MLNSLAKVNEYVALGQQQELINLCESAHKEQLNEIYDKIVEKGSRVVLVTGPSSSGKTTFSHNLSIKFDVLPLVLSVDDFFYGSDEIERSDDDINTFESIAGVNVELLNECVYSLLRYEPTNIPRFDFATERSVKNYNRVILRKGQKIIIEGTHSFNEKLMPGLGEKEKFKAFIHVGTDLEVDNGETVSGRDIRLIRRSVRDQFYRGADVARTQMLWKNVVIHENEAIIPYIKSADGVFDSFLAYEPCIMKGYLNKFLKESNDVENTKYIRTLNEKLKKFESVDEKLILNESILKEFIKR